MVLTDFPQIFEAENTSIMAVGEVESECVSADYRHLVEGDVVGDAVGAEYLFARPFIDARSTRATASKLRCGVFGVGIVRPCDRDLTV